ncbi:MAG: hypothetical protein QG578_668 [Thermodesulfobacteriota bacterium]|nr:hypothetical protein [Thermodesulfobacteriota bacterium]
MYNPSKTNQELTEEISCLKQTIRELKKAEAKHNRESRDKLSLITGNMADCVSLVDASGTYQYITPSYGKVLGYSSKDMIGISGFSFIHPDDLERVLKLYRDGIKQNLNEFRYETRFRHRSGHYVPMEVRTSSLRDAKGKIIGGVVGARDITEKLQIDEERRRAEDALADSEHRRRNLADTLSNAMVYKLAAEPDGGRRFIYVSRAVERLNEATEEEVLADAGVIYRQVLPEYRRIVSDREEEALKNLTTMQVEVQSRLPSGCLRWFEYTSTPHLQADGLLVWNGVEVDITDRKRAEEALRESEKRLNLITENMVDCVALLDTSGTYQFVTPSYREVLGYSPEELVGISGFSFLHPDDLEYVMKLYMDGMEQGLCEIRYETSLRHKNGHYVPLEVRARSLKDANGKITGVVLAARDITERKLTEEELDKYRKQLEKMVKERTAELENKNITLQELNTTLKVLLAQREDDKKDMEERFVLNVRNLVLPYVERMKTGPLDINQRPYLEIIETHLNEIATPLLKNMRQFKLTPREIKVAALVKQGRSTKEIAEILRISTGSIDIHRKHIREKLGLKDRKANLQAYIENLEQ